MEKPPEQILRDCDPFRSLEDAVLERVARIGRIRRFEPGDAILRRGEPCPGLFAVDSGLVKVFNLAPNGREHVLHLCGPGRTFAEVAAFGGFDMPASAAALEPTRCLMLPAEPLRRLLDDDHALCRQLLVGLSFWVRRLVGNLEDLALRDAGGRLAAWLLEAPPDDRGRISPPGLKRDWANRLNLTSETISRLLRKLTEDGVLEAESARRFRIRDREALERLAEGSDE
jgi:CRP/FNR family transcriptional regulator